MRNLQQQGPSLREQLNFGKWLATFPALTAIVVFRRGIGKRLLDIPSLVAVCGAMVFFSVWPPTPNSEGLAFFAIFAFGLGMAHRKKWQTRYDGGERVHSFDLGGSHLRALPLPNWLKQNGRVERFIDPLLCMGLGVLFWFVSPALGCWLVLAGLCLRLFESVVWDLQRNRQMDTTDAMIEAEIQEDIIEHYSMRVHRPADPANGIPTGYDAEIQKTVLRRKVKPSKPHQS